MHNTAIDAPPPPNASASLSRSRNNTRLGNAVSASWCAKRSICATARRRSVMSSWVETQPPSGIGSWWIAIVRPSASTVAVSEALSDTAIAARHARYCAEFMSEKLPAA